MCWVAADRGAALADLRGRPDQALGAQPRPQSPLRCSSMASPAGHVQGALRLRRARGCRCSSFRSSASSEATIREFGALCSPSKTSSWPRGSSWGAGRGRDSRQRARRSRSAHGGSSRARLHRRGRARTRLPSGCSRSEAGSASTPSTSIFSGSQLGNFPMLSPTSADRRAAARDPCPSAERPGSRAPTGSGRRPRQSARRRSARRRSLAQQRQHLADRCDPAFRSTRSTPTARVPM